MEEGMEVRGIDVGDFNTERQLRQDKSERKRSCKDIKKATNDCMEKVTNMNTLEIESLMKTCHQREAAVCHTHNHKTHTAKS